MTSHLQGISDPYAYISPLLNPIFLPVIKRIILLYFAGFVLIWLLNKGKLKNIWSTNVGQRYLSWLVIGPLYMFTVFFGGDLSLAVLIILLILALWEVARITKISREYVIALYLLAGVSVYIASYHREYFYSLPLMYFGIVTFLANRNNDPKHGFFHAATTLFALIWLVFSLSHFVLLGHMNNILDSTKSLLILLGFAVPLSDIGAYVVGNFFHKIKFLDQYKLASNISPKKTYVGALGNVLGAAIGVWIMYFAIQQYLPWYHWIIIAGIIGLYGVSGDITESMFKRYFGVKDSSTLIPGHGGILDRIDSTARVIVVLYYYLVLVL